MTAKINENINVKNTVYTYVNGNIAQSKTANIRRTGISSCAAR